MSESLRARLKRSSRYFTSPATPKRPCIPNSSLATTPIAMGIVDQERLKSPRKQENVSTSDCVIRNIQKRDSVIQYENYSTYQTYSDSNSNKVTLKGEEQLDDLKLIKSTLVQRIAEKEEVLRKLNLVKLQHEKNDISVLRMLTGKWKSVAQQVIADLWVLTSDPKPTLTELVDHYQIEHTMIGFQVDDESFS